MRKNFQYAKLPFDNGTGIFFQFVVKQFFQSSAKSISYTSSPLLSL